MDSQKLNRLRIYCHSLMEQQRTLSLSVRKDTVTVEELSILPLLNELIKVTNEFPDLLPEVDPKIYSFVSDRGERYCYYVGIMTHTANVLGHLRVEIEQPTNTPVTENKLFPFINDSDLRKIIERDYGEIQRAYIAQCWKSVIILCGGAIEAVLTDLLKTHENEARDAKSAPQNPEITCWDLSPLIKVAVELKLVTSSVEKLSHSLREYRNLVHPGNEIRAKLGFDAEEAKIAIEVLNILHRDLSK